MHDTYILKVIFKNLQKLIFLSLAFIILDNEDFLKVPDDLEKPSLPSNIAP